MKFLVLLICLAGAAYYCFFHNPEIGNKITTKLGINRETAQQASPQPSKPTELHELKFKENTLGARLTEMSKYDKFGIFFERLNSSWANIPPKATDADLKKALEQNAETLQAARSLEKYDEFGLLAEESELHNDTVLHYTSSFSTACAILTISGKIQAASGNAAAAEKDFARAAKLINVCLNGSHPMVGLLSISRCQNELKTYILNSKLPRAVKQKLLKSLPDRNAYAIAIPQTLDIEKEFLRNACEVVQKSNKTAQELYMQEKYVQALKKLSPDKIEKYWPMGAEQIIKKFADGTLSRQTKIDIGSKEGNFFVETFMFPTGYGKMSESQANGKKKLKTNRHAK